MANYEIRAVVTRRNLRRFVTFPDSLYNGCPQYVPALHSDQMHTLTKDAALEYCKHKMWLVTDGGKVAGRICAMLNPRYNERYSKKCVRFGWFDCINDPYVAKLLLGAAEQWAREQGMDHVHGPLFFNTLGKQGMLVEGFENVPPFNCIYNYPYYPELLEGLGYRKECDWVQYRMRSEFGVPDKTRRVAKLIQERYNLHFGSIDALKKDKELVRRFFRVYSDSFKDRVYNFIPFTDAEVEQEARTVLPFVNDRNSVVLFDEAGEIVAFGICTASLSKALQKARGRLFPFGWLHILKAKNDFSTMDLLLNGAAPEWQHKGVSALYYLKMAEKAAEFGYGDCISNPQIESNSAANIWNGYPEHSLYMRRRCYIKEL